MPPVRSTTQTGYRPLPPALFFVFGIVMFAGKVSTILAEVKGVSDILIVSNADWQVEVEEDSLTTVFERLTNEANNHCDFPVVQGKVTPQEFRARYWGKSPVIFRGIANDWPATKKWSKNYLTTKYGNITAMMGTSSSVQKNEGSGDKEVLFSKYLDMTWTTAADSIPQIDHDYEEVDYLFDRHTFMQEAVERGILADVGAIDFFPASDFKRRRKNHARKSQHELTAFAYLFLSPFWLYAGIGFHQHTEGWNAHLAGDGVKLWALYPRGMGDYLKEKGVLDGNRHWCCNEDSWIHQVLPQVLATSELGPGNSKPLFCTQRKGDVVYLPGGWFHATLSGPGGVVGIAEQRSTFPHFFLP